jgi:GTP-binding protein HflX
VHRDGEVLTESHHADGTRLSARVDAGLAAVLTGFTAPVA